eukprot:10593234-Alexandrium_andersonii.AAC.1
MSGWPYFARDARTCFRIWLAVGAQSRSRAAWPFFNRHRRADAGHALLHASSLSAPSTLEPWSSAWA